MTITTENAFTLRVDFPLPVPAAGEVAADWTLAALDGLADVPRITAAERLSDTAIRLRLHAPLTAGGLYRLTTPDWS